MYELHSERNGVCTLHRTLIKTRADARIVVETMEKEGTWPEGHDALLVYDDGQEYMLVDDWEKMS